MKKLLTLVMVIGLLIVGTVKAQDRNHSWIPPRAIYLCDIEWGKVYYDPPSKDPGYWNSKVDKNTGKTHRFYVPPAVVTDKWGDHTFIEVGVYIDLNAKGRAKFFDGVTGAGVPGHRLTIPLQIDCKGHSFHIDTPPFGFSGWKPIPSDTWIEGVSKKCCD
jgi:hypothetical protein